MVTLNKSGIDMIKVATSLLMLGIFYIVFNGRKTLNVLKDLILIELLLTAARAVISSIVLKNNKHEMLKRFTQ